MRRDTENAWKRHKRILQKSNHKRDAAGLSERPAQFMYIPGSEADIVSEEESGT